MSLADFMTGALRHVQASDDDDGGDPRNGPSKPIIGNADFPETSTEPTLISAARYNDVQMIERLGHQGLDFSNVLGKVLIAGFHGCFRYGSNYKKCIFVILWFVVLCKWSAIMSCISKRFHAKIHTL